MQPHLLLERVEPPELDPEPERRVWRVPLALALLCGLDLLESSTAQLRERRVWGHEPEEVFCVRCESRFGSGARGLVCDELVDVRRVPNTEGRIDRYWPQDLPLSLLTPLFALHFILSRSRCWAKRRRQITRLYHHPKLFPIRRGGRRRPQRGPRSKPDQPLVHHPVPQLGLLPVCYLQQPQGDVGFPSGRRAVFRDSLEVVP